MKLFNLFFLSTLLSTFALVMDAAAQGPDVPPELRGLVGKITEKGRNYYSPVGLIVTQNAAGEVSLGTGTVIDGGFVLTAAHVVEDAVRAKFFYGGVGGREFSPTSKTIHPYYRDPRSGQGNKINYQFDLAVLNLNLNRNLLGGQFNPNAPDPQRIQSLALPYNSQTSKGDNILFVGFGNQGNGSIGELPAVSQDQTKHYGWSKVDFDNGDGYLGFRFDRGEAIIGRGDSGGPVLDSSTIVRSPNGVYRGATIVGVNSHVFARENPDGTLQTVFGTRANSVRVANHMNWIRYATLGGFFRDPNAVNQEIQRNLAQFGILNVTTVGASQLMETSLQGDFNFLLDDAALIGVQDFRLPAFSVPEPPATLLMMLAMPAWARLRRRRTVP